jgi:hypothetical protein
MTEGRGSWEQEQKPPQRREKRLLWLLDLVELRPYTVEPSHGVSPFAVALAKTTLEGEDACGYPSAKTVHSIVTYGNIMRWAPCLRAPRASPPT